MDEEVKSKLIMDKEDLAGEEIESTFIHDCKLPRKFKKRVLLELVFRSS